MSDAFLGSVEIVAGDGSSIGVAGRRWTPEAVPPVLETLHGLTDLHQVPPQPQATGRVPEASWTAIDDRGGIVRVMLWREDRELTFVEIAAAIQASEGEW